MEKPVLELTTQITRPAVVIDGERYGLVTKEELSFVEFHALEKKAERLMALGSKKGITEDEVQELAQTIDELSRELLPDVPDEVRVKLTDQQRMKICEAFMGPQSGEDKE